MSTTIFDPTFGSTPTYNVSNTDERNAIPNKVRITGMLVNTSDGEMWQLLRPPWTGTNSDWALFSSGHVGSGTVTSVSVADVNGVSGSVANPTTTPAITISLGHIQPTSIGTATTATTQSPGDNSTKIATTAYADAASSSGTVTSVSVVTANGVSGSVATDTTTPAITLVLGAITPSSIGSATTATTQSPGDNSTKIATTAYADAAGGGASAAGTGGRSWAPRCEDPHPSRPVDLVVSLRRSRGRQAVSASLLRHRDRSVDRDAAGGKRRWE